MAVTVSLKTNCTIDHIIWEMPLTQCITIANIVTCMVSERAFETKLDILGRRKKMQILEEKYGD